MLVNRRLVVGFLWTGRFLPEYMPESSTDPFNVMETRPFPDQMTSSGWWQAVPRSAPPSADGVVATVVGHALLEFLVRQVLDQLREDGAADVDPLFLSRLRLPPPKASCALRQFKLFPCRVTSNPLIQRIIRSLPPILPDNSEGGFSVSSWRG